MPSLFQAPRLLGPLNWESANTKIKRAETGESPPLSENLEQAKLGQDWKWVWILEIWAEKGCGKWHFWSDIWTGFGEPGGTPSPRFPRSTPPGGSGAGCTDHHNHRLEYDVGWFISVIIHVYVSNPSPLNTAFLHRGMPLYWPSRLSSSFPHIPKALFETE